MRVLKFKIVFVLCCLVAASGCTRKEETIKVLSSQGYTGVEVKGYSFFGCSKDDWFHTKFTAISSANGERVSGVVCTGLFFKGSTVRFK